MNPLKARLLNEQLGAPSGLWGLWCGRYMNNLNQPMIMHALQALPPEHCPEIVDVGFGGGRSLELLLASARFARVIGVEPSETMLARAKRRYRRAMRAGALQLLAGTAESMPLASCSAAAVCSINTLYFWSGLPQGLSELARVLKPQGRLVLAFRARGDMEALPFTRTRFKLYDVAQVLAALRAAGLTPSTPRPGHDGHLGFVCIAATK